VPEMNSQEQHQNEQKFFCNLAAALMERKLTPEMACSMIEKLRDAKIFAEDILEPEDQEKEQQKCFNEIANVFADWKITTEEACELFEEWIDEWKKEGVSEGLSG
jgi:signal recognition particle GTPase